jgi:AAA domain-containing protein
MTDDRILQLLKETKFEWSESDDRSLVEANPFHDEPLSADGSHLPSGRLSATPLTEVSMRSIEWVERPLWQASAFQLLAGEKGSGKGTYLAALAARITRTGASALFLSSEDSAEIDLKPRLVAAGADIDRCYVIQQHVKLPADVPELRALAEEIGGVGLFVIDPVANHIGNTKTGDDGEVRNAIAPLNRLADELGCLLIGVRHPGKDRSRGPVASILGSTAWVDTPRAVVFIAKDDQDPLVRHIQVVAGNRSLNGSAQAFRIEAVPVQGLTEPITLAVPLGESAKDVGELLAMKPAESRTDQARTLLLDILEAEGDQESDTLDARVARKTGLAAGTVKNTRTKLKDEGLVKNYPEKDETGAITRWRVRRTAAPRP